MAKIKRMDQIRTILQTWLTTGKIKPTARRLKVSRNTVRQYLRLAKAADKDISVLLSLSDEQLRPVFYPDQANEKADRRAAVFEQRTDYFIKELRRKGVTRYLLWQEYRNEHSDGYAYTQFCEHLKRAIGRKELTLALHHKPGEKLQLDFAGHPMHYIDQSTGEQIKCEVLVAVLPHSHYTFAVALPSQKVADFIDGINQLFRFLGCLPQSILSDNLKSYVTKANRYDPTFNELCVQLATHYQIDLDATRVAKPKDKGSVENMVANVYRRIYAPLRNETFFSLHELNMAISQQLEVHNNQPFQQKQGTRRQLFEEFEQPLMRPLPSDPFEIKKTIKAKVQRNYHIMLGEEKNYYSVPFQYAGKDAIAIYTSKNVEIYIDNQRVGTHQRLPGRDTYKYQTNPAHMPQNHAEWEKSRGYDAAYFLKQAEKVGQAAHWAMTHLLSGKIHEAQSYKACEGTLRLAKNFSPQRLEAAAQRCKAIGKVNYKMLERILKKGLDQTTDQYELFSPPQHRNIRGPEAYQ